MGQNFPTLPRPGYDNAWSEARRLHFERFSKPVKSIFDCICMCGRREDIEASLRRLLPSKKRNVLLDAICSGQGREYIHAISGFHNSEDIDKNLLTGSGEYLLHVLEHLLDLYGRSVYAEEGVIARCNEFLHRVFDFDSFCKGRLIKSKDGAIYWGSDASGRAWGTAEFIEQTGLKYCPYCNAETVYSIPKGDGTRTKYKSPVDHYLPRKWYPYFALSLSNLVPSCFRCNSSYKSMKDPIWFPQNGKSALSLGGKLWEFRLPHPYVEDIHSGYHFCVTFSKDCKNYSLFGKESPISLNCDFSDSTDGKLQILTEALFHMSKTYTKLFVPDAKSFLRRLKMLRPVYLRQLAAKYEAGRAIDVGFLLCGFRSSEDPFAFRLGKMHSDLLNRFAPHGIEMQDT